MTTRRAIVIGNIGIDENWRLARLPRPGETLLASALTRDLGGKGANQAIVLARAGIATRLVAGLGDDAEAAWLRARLAAEGLDTGGMIAMAAPTDRSVILVAADGENAIASTAGCAHALRPADVDAALADADAGNVVVLQGNLSVPVTSHALRAARAAGARTVFNPAPVDPGFAALWPLVDLVVMNAGEAALLTGLPDPAEAARRILAEGAGRVVVTLGGQGAIFLMHDSTIRVPAAPADVMDTTGAGDTFVGVLIAAGLLHGANPAAALSAAAAAAAVTIGRVGTLAAFPTRTELAAILGAHRDGDGHPATPAAQPSTLDHNRA
jgi:ribokinase